MVNSQIGHFVIKFHGQIKGLPVPENLAMVMVKWLKIVILTPPPKLECIYSVFTGVIMGIVGICPNEHSVCDYPIYFINDNSVRI